MNAPTYTRTEERQSTWTDLPEALDSLWSACLSDNGGRDVARALTVNLIGVADADGADCLHKTCTLLQRRSPCRAFLLLHDESLERHEARLCAATRSHGSLRDIVLEQIELRTPTRELQKLPGLLRPLILDDLPSHLLWARSWPRDRTNFDVLGELCTHTIVDSARFEEPARDLRALAECRAAGRPITDLAWLRVRPWRRALAEAFERFRWRDGLAVTGTIRHGRGARAEAMLLADWLGDRLHASIALTAHDGDASHGPDHVSLQVGDVTVSCELRDDALVTHVNTEEHCYLPFAVAARRGSDADLVATALDRA